MRAAARRIKASTLRLSLRACGSRIVSGSIPAFRKSGAGSRPWNSMSRHMICPMVARLEGVTAAVPCASLRPQRCGRAHSSKGPRVFWRWAQNAWRDAHSVVARIGGHCLHENPTAEIVPDGSRCARRPVGLHGARRADEAAARRGATRSGRDCQRRAILAAGRCDRARLRGARIRAGAAGGNDRNRTARRPRRNFARRVSGAPRPRARAL